LVLKKFISRRGAENAERPRVIYSVFSEIYIYPKRPIIDQKVALF